MKSLKSYLNDKDFIAFDTETDGVDKESRVIGFSTCAELDVAHYVILAYWSVENSKLIYLETMDGAKDFMQALLNKKLIMQNAPFDCSMILNNFGVELMPSVHTDTLVLGHFLNENRSNGLKERGIELYGENAAAEQAIMKESVFKNGGQLTKANYELYKADSDLIAHYGAKDALLTYKIFLNDVEILFEEKLDEFFYDDECMPLLRGPTYDMNTTGLRVDPAKLQNLKGTLEAECAEAQAYILKETFPYVEEKYTATGKTNHFNIGSNKQLAWLLFIKLGNEFNVLTKGGRELCKAMNFPIPYNRAAKRNFIQMCVDNKDFVYKEEGENVKTGKKTRAKKISDPWNYTACGKESLIKFSTKYKWVDKLLEYKKNLKLLNTYVEGIQERLKYNIIRPSFLQIGTTSGRYSSKGPNFQNLPREDKRVKSCIIARPSKIFIGADFEQLEPRIFAYYSQDARLINSFKNKEDFYSVIGVDVFNKHGCSLKKDAKDSFAKLYPVERQLCKPISLGATYGATAAQIAKITGKSIEESEDILNSYFENFPQVHDFMLSTHNEVKIEGKVYNLFGRPRRMAKATLIPKLFGSVDHGELPYEYRTLLNLSVNHKIQSTAASIVNRCAISFWDKCRANSNPLWREIKIILQVHDELVSESPESIAEEVAKVLKDCMENTVQLPGVDLVAQPKLAYNLADLK